MEPPQLLVQRAALATALFALLVYLVCLWWWETKSWERYVVEKEAPAWIVYGTAWEAQWAIAACALALCAAACAFCEGFEVPASITNTLNKWKDIEPVLLEIEEVKAGRRT